MIAQQQLYCNKPVTHGNTSPRTSKTLKIHKLWPQRIRLIQQYTEVYQNNISCSIYTGGSKRHILDENCIIIIIVISRKMCMATIWIRLWRIVCFVLLHILFLRLREPLRNLSLLTPLSVLHFRTNCYFKGHDPGIRSSQLRNGGKIQLFMQLLYLGYNI